MHSCWNTAVESRIIVELLLGALKRIIEGAGNYAIFSARAVKLAFLPPFRLRLILSQMEFIGVNSFFIVFLTGSFAGMVFALQSSYAFKLFSAQDLVGSTVALSLTREIGPVFTALVVTGRAGSAMAAELGAMRVTEQIDALETMAVEPIQYLAAPRLIASTVMLPVLTMVFDAVGTIGAYIVGVYYVGIDAGTFINRIQYYVDPEDVYNGLIKAAVFGMVMATVSCYKGFFAKGGAKGVGEAITRAVVLTSVSVLFVDLLMTALMGSGVGK
ncbi:MAG: ABC transporter permease [Deltaproteobacteria bacterium]|nr:ABC transporter permease [Deltaproteobacteria bacterium]